MKLIYPPIYLAAILLLAACSPKVPDQTPVLLETESRQLPTRTDTTPPATLPAEQDWSRVDEQGAVIVEVTPLNLGSPGQTLDFQVAMDTHSIDLSMDLATLSTIKTDTGLEVQASSWDGPLGGHHVSGTLSFPTTLAMLDGASLLTLTISSVDADARVFSWNLNP